jgi:leader peptidase (prepilin peptidase)/N-methyltransferase
MTFAAAAAGVAGVGLGYLTHLLNQRLTAGEPDATEPPLRLEALWAPLLDGLTVALLFFRFGVTWVTVVDSVIAVLLVQVLVFDARHRLILNVVIYPAIVAALLFAAVNPLLGGGDTGGRIASALIGGAIAGGVFYLLVLASRGGIGLGDAKLTLFLGLATGFFPRSNDTRLFPVILVMIYGVVLGGLAATVLLVTRVRRFGDYIAYGPFLCVGGITALLFPCGLFGPSSC